jgi:hypothetical protein
MHEDDFRRGTTPFAQLPGPLKLLFGSNGRGMLPRCSSDRSPLITDHCSANSTSILAVFIRQLRYENPLIVCVLSSLMAHY